MFLKIQRSINNIFIVFYFIVAIVLFGSYILFTKYTQISKSALAILFAIFILIFNIVLYVYKSNYESIKLFKMVKNEQIALAKIAKGTHYVKSRDVFFSIHEIYQFNTDIYLPNGSKIKSVLYEKVNDPDFSCLPGYCFVTYNGKEDEIGIVPNYMIMNMPKLEPIVREYEKKYTPKYFIAIKNKKGLTCKSIQK